MEIVATQLRAIAAKADKVSVIIQSYADDFGRLAGDARTTISTLAIEKIDGLIAELTEIKNNFR